MKKAKKLLFSSLAIVLVFSMCFLAGCRRTAAAPADVGMGGSVERPHPLISAQELMELIDSRDPNLVVIGVIDPAHEANPQNVSSRPIAGSFLVWRPDYSAAGSVEAIAREIVGIRRPRSDMELLLSRAGVTPNSLVVVYGGHVMQDAARVFWQLRVLGIENARMLDGGLVAWDAAGFPTGTAVRLAQQLPTVRFNAPNYAPSHFAVNLYQVRDALLNPDEWVVIDTRSPGEFNGGNAPGMAGAFGTGRMAGSVNQNWITAVDPNTMIMRSPEELLAIYGDIIRGRNVIAHCVVGVRSAHTWFVLSEVLGIPNVYLHGGGWVEWSFAASEISGERWPEILAMVEEWTDNGGPL